MRITGRTPTLHAGRYIRLVCKHWGHRFTAEYDDQHGKVDFGAGASVEMRASPDSLTLLIECDEAAATEMKQVIEEHINRVAHKEGTLVYTWDT